MKWKYFLGGVASLLIVILIAAGAYFMGRSDTPEGSDPGLPSPTLPAASPFITPDNSPTTEAPTTTPSETIIEAGGAVSFPEYSLTLEPGWTYDREHDEAADSDVLTITKGEYEIRIMQGATGGLACLYPSDPDYPWPSNRYTTYTTISTPERITFRRSGSEDDTGFTVCQQSGTDYLTPTTFGHISYSTPASPSEELLTQMDEMVSSLERL